MNNELGFNTVTGSNINGDNSYKLFTSISGAAALKNPVKVRSVVEKNMTEYLLRIPHMEANYSNNPTYVINEGKLSTKGLIKNKCFVESKKCYEVFGVDLFITNDYKIKLIEVNNKIGLPDNKINFIQNLLKLHLNFIVYPLLNYKPRITNELKKLKQDIIYITNGNNKNKTKKKLNNKNKTKKHITNKI